MKEFTQLDCYLLECVNAQSSWKNWQKTVFDKARTFDRQIFSKENVIALGHHLDSLARSCRNYTPGSIIIPDWYFCKNYSLDPCIQIGPGCSIKFTHVKGIFDGK